MSCARLAGTSVLRKIKGREEGREGKRVLAAQRNMQRNRNPFCFLASTGTLLCRSLFFISAPHQIPCKHCPIFALFNSAFFLRKKNKYFDVKIIKFKKKNKAGAGRAIVLCLRWLRELVFTIDWTWPLMHWINNPKTKHFPPFEKFLFTWM